VATLVAGVDDGHQPCPAGVDEVCSATAQHPPYPVERVIGAPAVSVGLLLDAAAANPAERVAAAAATP